MCVSVPRYIMPPPDFRLWGAADMVAALGNGLNLQFAEPKEAPSGTSSNGSRGAEPLPELLFDMEGPLMAAQTLHTPPCQDRCCPQLISRSPGRAISGKLNFYMLSCESPRNSCSEKFCISGEIRNVPWTLQEQQHTCPGQSHAWSRVGAHRAHAHHPPAAGACSFGLCCPQEAAMHHCGTGAGLNLHCLIVPRMPTFWSTVRCAPG